MTQASLPVHGDLSQAGIRRRGVVCPSGPPAVLSRATQSLDPSSPRLRRDKPAPSAPPCWPPVADDRLGPLDQPTPRTRVRGSARRIPAVAHAPAAHQEDGLVAHSLYNPDGMDDVRNGISQGIRDAPTDDGIRLGVLTWPTIKTTMWTYQPFEGRNHENTPM